MLVLYFNVEGDPAPQGSKSAFVINGRARLVEASGKKLKVWRAAVTEAAKEAMQRSQMAAFPLDEPLEVSITFYMPVPKTVKVRDLHYKKPDMDKMVRAVLDSLTDAGVWVDDSRVSRFRLVEKVYAHSCPPGAHVEVRHA